MGRVVLGQRNVQAIKLAWIHMGERHLISSPGSSARFKAGDVGPDAVREVAATEQRVEMIGGGIEVERPRGIIRPVDDVGSFSSRLDADHGDCAGGDIHLDHNGQVGAVMIEILGQFYAVGNVVSGG